MAERLYFAAPSHALRSQLYAVYLLAVRRRAARLVGRGGWPALNGQARRRDAVCDLVRSYRPDVIVETGTYLASSTSFFAQFGVPVFTVDVSDTYHWVARLRLRTTRGVTLGLGDSRDLVYYLATDKTVHRFERPFFYLDAHWQDHLPLKEELDAIWQNWPQALIVVDDFRVPDDDGYGWDDYGHGNVITIEYCDPPAGVAVAFPALRSEAETGRRRGTCYMATGPEATNALREAVAGGHLRTDAHTRLAGDAPVPAP